MEALLEDDWQGRAHQEWLLQVQANKRRDYLHWLLLLTYIAFAISGTGYLILLHPAPLLLTDQEIQMLRIVACLPKAIVVAEWIRVALFGRIKRN